MSYQMHMRDPLLDINSRQILARRSKELTGFALFAVGAVMLLSLWTHASTDPNRFLNTTTDGTIQNILGRFGADLSGLLLASVGWSSYFLAVFCLIWGGRFLLRRGEDRFVQSLFYLLPAFPMSILYFGTLSIEGVQGWTSTYGLGGVLGDVFLDILLGTLQAQAEFGFKLFSLGLGLGFFATALASLGISWYEFLYFLRFLIKSLQVTLGYFITRRPKAAPMPTPQPAPQPMAHAAYAPQAPAPPMAPTMAQPAAQWSEVSTPYAPLPQQDIPASPPVPPWLQSAQTERPSSGASAGLPPAPRMAGPVYDPFHSPADPWDDPHRLPQTPIFDKPDQKEPRIRAKIARALEERARRQQPIAPAPIEPHPYPATYDAPQPSAFDQVALTTQSAVAAVPNSIPEEPKGFIAKAVRSVQNRRAARRAEPPAPVPTYAPEAHLGAAPPSSIPQSFPSTHQHGMTGYADTVPSDLAMMTAQPVTPQPAQASAPMVPAEPALPQEHMPMPSVSAPQKTPLIAAPIAHPKTPLRTRTAPPMSARQDSVAQVQDTAAQTKRQPAKSAAPTPLHFEFPPLDLLTPPAPTSQVHLTAEALQENAQQLEGVLEDYGIKGEIVDVCPGPVVTMYELEPAPGLKASRVISLADDIARSMSALSARVSTIPGRSVIGIELPNENREMVAFREMLTSAAFTSGAQQLPLALGKNIGGEPVVADLAKMPHLLIAGTTGSGKSVAINTMILSLLYKLTPDECRLIMVDPKMLELSVYDGIPHLLSPVVTDPKKAIVALKWVVGEMEERYRKMSKLGVRNIAGYNAKVDAALAKGEMFKRTLQTGFDEDSGDPIFETEEIEPEKMPFIVVIVDEVADLMMVAGKEIEACMQRLAQMARASGIHLIMATQRPSVDVITGTLKSNFPTRISFQVTSKIDSRTILGEMGAEQLLGMGDMLYMAGGGRITRCHGPFVSDQEVEEVVNHLKVFGPPKYVDTVLKGPDDEQSANIDAVLGLGGNTTGEDALYDQAVQIVITDRKCSTSYIQRKLAIGYNKAARLVEQMEDEGLVSAANHVGKREILAPEPN